MYSVWNILAVGSKSQCLGGTSIGSPGHVICYKRLNSTTWEDAVKGCPPMYQMISIVKIEEKENIDKIMGDTNTNKVWVRGTSMRWVWQSSTGKYCICLIILAV